MTTVLSLDDIAAHVWIAPHYGSCNNVRDLSIHRHYFAQLPKAGTTLGGGFTLFFECNWHAGRRLRQHKTEEVHLRDVLVLKNSSREVVVPISSSDLPLVSALLAEWVVPILLVMTTD